MLFLLWIPVLLIAIGFVYQWVGARRDETLTSVADAPGTADRFPAPPRAGVPEEKIVIVARGADVEKFTPAERPPETFRALFAEPAQATDPGALTTGGNRPAR